MDWKHEVSFKTKDIGLPVYWDVPKKIVVGILKCNGVEPSKIRKVRGSEKFRIKCDSHEILASYKRVDLKITKKVLGGVAVYHADVGDGSLLMKNAFCSLVGQFGDSVDSAYAVYLNCGTTLAQYAAVRAGRTKGTIYCATLIFSYSKD